MLVLTRRVGEIIDIEPDIEVMVSRIRGDKVCLSIKADGRVVHRREITERIQRETDTSGDADRVPCP